MSVEKRFLLYILGLAFVFFGCTSAATRQAIQGDYENALRLFNQLPPNAKECAPQEYAKTEATLAHIEEELSEEHWYYAKKYIPMADEEVRDTKATAKRRCPSKPKAPPPPPPPVEKPTFILEGITFDFDKATIRPSSEPTLKEAGSVLQRFTTVKVRIEGYTDSVGPDAYNQALSERRANSVKDYLIKNFGVDPSRVATVGFGESKPVADNKTDQGRAENRRIQFVITEQ
jgi:outer membrane protein OmpA-like peptidoglycan-associated protein